jgi:MFS transporter, ACDE family, multidrug resistance protein
MSSMSLRSAFVLGFVAFVTSFGAHVVAVNLPVYAREVGVGLAMIGLLIAAYDFAEVIAKPLFGALADRAGMKKTMLVGIGVFIAASLLYLWIPPRLLLLVRFLQGVGAAALSAVSLALVGVYYQDRRGRAFGIYNAVKGAGYVLSPIAGGLLVLHANFGAIFIACAAVGVLALLCALTLADPGEEAHLDADDDDISLAALMAVVRQPSLLRWYGVIVVNMFFVGILFGFVPVRVHALRYGTAGTTVLLSLTALSYLAVQPIAGRMADATDAATTIKIGLALSGVAVVAVPFLTGSALDAVCVLAGLGVGTVWTNTDALVSSLARAGRLGATMGVAGSFKELGDMLGPALIGALSQALGLTAGFVICGILGIACAALLRNIPILPPARPEAPAEQMDKK